MKVFHCNSYQTPSFNIASVSVRSAESDGHGIVLCNGKNKDKNKGKSNEECEGRTSKNKKLFVKKQSKVLPPAVNFVGSVMESSAKHQPRAAKLN